MAKKKNKSKKGGKKSNNAGGGAPKTASEDVTPSASETEGVEDKVEEGPCN